MSNESTDNVTQAIKSIYALMYERNQAYAFIAVHGFSNEFLKFVQEKQYARASDEDLRKLLQAIRMKPCGTSGEDAGHPNRVKKHGTK